MVNLLIYILYYVLSIQYTGKSFFLVYLNKIIFRLRSNLTSPKWKNFRGSRIACQDKIRLNNVIWRTWHQQCQINKKVHFLFIVHFFRYSK
jgi:hypothetical protein